MIAVVNIRYAKFLYRPPFILMKDLQSRLSTTSLEGSFNSLTAVQHLFLVRLGNCSRRQATPAASQVLRDNNFRHCEQDGRHEQSFVGIVSDLVVVRPMVSLSQLVER